ncbi:MAG: iron-containing alcohol dehydrogenase [Candidatus Aminicenantales bacterium]
MTQEELKRKARNLIREFKGDTYVFGLGCLPGAGPLARELGGRVCLITSLHIRDPENFHRLSESLQGSGLTIAGHTRSARPNAPREDVARIRETILETRPEFIFAASGGSGIDATKAAIVLASLGGDVEDYFGTGKVTEKRKEAGKKLLPLIALQTASSSAAHLTKYANITDLSTHQKKLIVDEALVPQRCLFDYELTFSMSHSVTCDGALDGLAHLLEVYSGSKGDALQKIEEIALTGTGLILGQLEKALASPEDPEAREALGLATDLGGYAIMMGSTSGPHLMSFSLVDVLSHGRACAVLNPYFIVLFSRAITPQVKKLASLMAAHRLISNQEARLRGRDLAEAVARGLVQLNRRVGLPGSLSEVEGFRPAHAEKILDAAKDPALEMKLRSMPIPMTAATVEKSLRPLLEAAEVGDLRKVPVLAG